MSQTLAFVERCSGFGNQTDGAVPRQGEKGEQDGRTVREIRHK